MEGALCCGGRCGSELPLPTCAHRVTLGRPAATPAPRKSFLPSAIGMLKSILFRLVSYTKHRMRKHITAFAVIPKVPPGAGRRPPQSGVVGSVT